MMLIAVIIGLLSKKPIKKLDIKYIGLLYFVLGIQIVIRLLALITDMKILDKILNPIHIITFLIIFIFSVYNKGQVGILILGIGFMMNLLVMIVNGGKMPVLINGVAEFDLRHSLMTAETKLRLLGDIISLPYPLSIGMIRSSIGDIVIVLGMMIIVAQLVYWERVRDSKQ